MSTRIKLSTVIKLSAFAFFCLAFTACPKRSDPNAEDTILGRSTPTRPDFSPGGSTGFGPDGRPLNLGPDGQPLSFEDGDSSLVGRGASGLQDPDGGIRGILPSIFFDFDQAFIRPDQRTALAETVEYLKRNTRPTVLIEGHCDFKGTREYNLALGDRRASSVRNFLVDSGIEASRINVISKGDLEAIDNASDDQRARDRRADIIIYE